MNSCGCHPSEESQGIAFLPLAIATVPPQPWIQPYDLKTGLKNGTIFPNLNLPFYKGGEIK